MESSGEAGDVGCPADARQLLPLSEDSGGEASIVEVSGRFDRRRCKGGDGTVSGRQVVVAGGGAELHDSAETGRDNSAGNGGDSELEGEVE